MGAIDRGLFGIHRSGEPRCKWTGYRKSDGTEIERYARRAQIPASEGVEGAETRDKQQLPATDPLSEGDANSLLKRIPEIKPAADDKTDFAKRIGTLPAPKTGNKIPVKFPSDEMRNRCRMSIRAADA